MEVQLNMRSLALTILPLITLVIATVPVSAIASPAAGHVGHGVAAPVALHAPFQVRQSPIGAARRSLRTGLTTPTQAQRAMIAREYGQSPLRFEVNQGQTGDQVRFLSRGTGYTLFLTGTDAVLSLATAQARAHVSHQPAPRIMGGHRNLLLGRVLPHALVPAALQPQPTVTRSVVRLHLAGSNPHPRVVGLDRLPGVSNYFIGRDPRHWRTNVPSYARVAYRGVYPGVDLIYYGNQGRLEYDLIVAPGATPQTIRLSVAGVRRVQMNGAGNVVLRLAVGDVHQIKPVIYQKEGRTKHQVQGRYVLLADHTIGFQIGAYDRHKPLIIDPVLVYSTYLGGSGGNTADTGTGIAVDGGGAAYVTGFAGSGDFPTTPGAFSTTYSGHGYSDAFVTKLSASGDALVYSTYLGGSDGKVAGVHNGSSGGNAIAVDGAGAAYVTGDTSSTDFPTTPGAFSVTDHGYNAFVTKLSASGDALVYSTYLGGSYDDEGNSIAVDGAGAAYVTGLTSSRGSTPKPPIFLTRSRRTVQVTERQA